LPSSAGSQARPIGGVWAERRAVEPIESVASFPTHRRGTRARIQRGRRELRSLGGRDHCSFDRDRDICGVRALNSCRARHPPLCLLCRTDSAETARSLTGGRVFVGTDLGKVVAIEGDRAALMYVTVHAMGAA